MNQAEGEQEVVRRIKLLKAFKKLVSLHFLPKLRENSCYHLNERLIVRVMILFKES